MIYSGLDEFLADRRRVLSQGPVALIFAEDGAALAETLDHHRKLGFARIVLFLPERLDPPDAAEGLVAVRYPTMAPDAVPHAVNAVISAAPEGTWLYYGFNAEFLFYPFCEGRSVGELLSFHAGERRAAMLSYVIDLYAPDLGAAPDAVSLDDAQLDSMGYYALARHDEVGHPRERQLDVFGGLRWRFEEHVPGDRRRIDRIALFRTRRGLKLLPDHRLNDEELNTYACPWHNNVTAAICSFRTAKALRSNPASREAITSFRWDGSVPFGWSSRQLLDMGMIEPGQWF